MERWSYKPEVEGLTPSLGTNLVVSSFGFRVSSSSVGITINTELKTQNSKLIFSGRDSSRQNGDCPGAWSSKRRVGLTPRPHCIRLSIRPEKIGDVAPTGRAAVL